MKKVIVLSLLLVTPLLGQDATDSSATPLLENPDMADGTTHWHGNAKVAGADSSTDLTTGQNSAKGITIDLRPTTWAEITQQLHGLPVYPGPRGTVRIPSVQLTIVFQTSPDFSLSTKDTDYADIGSSLGFDNVKINAHPGQLMAFVDYPVVIMRPTGVMQAERLAAEYITPKAGQQPQTFTASLTFTSLQGNDLNFCLAFPPGAGSVTLTKVSMTALPLKSQQ